MLELVLAFVFIVFPPVPAAMLHNPDFHAVLAQFGVRFVLISMLQGMLNAILTTPCMVATHRSILLDEAGKSLNDARRLVYFWAWLMVLGLVEDVPVLLFHVSPWILVLMLPIAIIMVRFTLAFPAIALDVPAPLQESWNRTSGHWWYVFGVVFCGIFSFALIMIVTVMVVAGGAGFVIGLSGGMAEFHAVSAGPVGQAAKTLTNALNAMFTPVLAAAFASELYRKFGGLSDYQRDNVWR
jgi:hypothetical protein